MEVILGSLLPVFFALVAAAACGNKGRELLAGLFALALAEF